MTNPEYKGIIESLLFVWGDPMEISTIAQVLELPKKEIQGLLAEMRQEFREQGRGLELKQFGEEYQLTTRQECRPFLERLVGEKKAQRLTSSSMETLAIIAYKQPVTRMQIEDIRGVKSSSSVDTLLEKGMIEEAGRLDQIGKPILYRTSTKFLERFGLESLDQLPSHHQILEKLNQLKQEDVDGNAD